MFKVISKIENERRSKHPNTIHVHIIPVYCYGSRFTSLKLRISLVIIPSFHVEKTQPPRS